MYNRREALLGVLLAPLVKPLAGMLPNKPIAPCPTKAEQILVWETWVRAEKRMLRLYAHKPDPYVWERSENELHTKRCQYLIEHPKEKGVVPR